MYDFYNDIEEKSDFDVEDGEFSEEYVYGSVEDEYEIDKTIDEFDVFSYEYEDIS